MPGFIGFVKWQNLVVYFTCFVVGFPKPLMVKNDTINQVES